MVEGQISLSSFRSPVHPVTMERGGKVSVKNCQASKISLEKEEERDRQREKENISLSEFRLPVHVANI